MGCSLNKEQYKSTTSSQKTHEHEHNRQHLMQKLIATNNLFHSFTDTRGNQFSVVQRLDSYSYNNQEKHSSKFRTNSTNWQSKLLCYNANIDSKFCGLYEITEKDNCDSTSNTNAIVCVKNRQFFKNFLQSSPNYIEDETKENTNQHYLRSDGSRMWLHSNNKHLIFLHYRYGYNVYNLKTDKWYGC